MIEKEIKNGILYDNLKENNLSDLIIKLLKYNKDERIEWKEYFNYKFNKIIPKNLDILGKNRNPISKNEIDILCNKVLSICKIEYKINDKILEGCGFFVEIENEDIPIKYALFTNNYILNENDLKIDNKIKIEYFDTSFFSSNYKSNIIYIKITKDRFTITNKELDFTCIELFESDGILDYFKIDSKIFKYNKNNLEDNDIFI